VGSILREVAIILVLSLVLYLGINYTLQNSEVIGHSMEPNLHDQEYVLIYKMAYKFGNTPQRGDVVVFTPPHAIVTENDYIKRIIGLPGEVVEIKGGKVYIYQPMVISLNWMKAVIFKILPFTITKAMLSPKGNILSWEITATIAMIHIRGGLYQRKTL